MATTSYLSTNGYDVVGIWGDNSSLLWQRSPSDILLGWFRLNTTCSHHGSWTFSVKRRERNETTKIKKENNFYNLEACWIGLDEKKEMWMHNPINKINTKRLNKFPDFKFENFQRISAKHQNRKFWELVVMEFVSLQNFLKMPLVIFSYFLNEN